MTDDRSKIRGAFRGARSPDAGRRSLYWYLWHDYRALSEAAAKSYRKKMDWVGIAGAMTAAGFTSKDGGPVKPETIRKTWTKVKEDVASGSVVLPEEEPAPDPVKAEVEDRARRALPPLRTVVTPASDYRPPAIPMRGSKPKE